MFVSPSLMKAVILLLCFPADVLVPSVFRLQVYECFEYGYYHQLQCCGDYYLHFLPIARATSEITTTQRPQGGSALSVFFKGSITGKKREDRGPDHLSHRGKLGPLEFRGSGLRRWGFGWVKKSWAIAAVTRSLRQQTEIHLCFCRLGRQPRDIVEGDDSKDNFPGARLVQHGASRCGGFSS